MPSIAENLAKLPRHERLPDLLGASADPHPRKTRRVEWVGEASPLSNDRVLANLLMGRYTPTQERALRLAAARANTRGHRHRTRLLEHEHQHAQAVVKGLRRSYIFSEQNGYVQDVDYHDAEVIFSAPCAHEFRDLDAEDARQPVVLRASLEVFRLIATEVIARNDPRVAVHDVVAAH